MISIHSKQGKVKKNYILIVWNVDFVSNVFILTFLKLVFNFRLREKKKLLPRVGYE